MRTITIQQTHMTERTFTVPDEIATDEDRLSSFVITATDDDWFNGTTSEWVSTTVIDNHNDETLIEW